MTTDGRRPRIVSGVFVFSRRHAAAFSGPPLSFFLPAGWLAKFKVEVPKLRRSKLEVGFESESGHDPRAGRDDFSRLLHGEAQPCFSNGEVKHKLLSRHAMNMAMFLHQRETTLCWISPGIVGPASFCGRESAK